MAIFRVTLFNLRQEETDVYSSAAYQMHSKQNLSDTSTTLCNICQDLLLKLKRLSLGAIWDSAQSQAAGMQTQVPEPQCKPACLHSSISLILLYFSFPSGPVPQLPGQAEAAVSQCTRLSWWWYSHDWSWALLIKQAKWLPLRIFF